MSHSTWLCLIFSQKGKHLVFHISQITFKPVILNNISLRASTFSFDNLERRVLKTGDFFQLQIEVSGGRVEWYKDGVLVPTIAWDEFQEWEDTTPLVNVDQPGRTQLLAPDTYPKFRWARTPQSQPVPPNRCCSFLGGRCQVHTMIIQVISIH